jgi:hypothetical protein
MTPIKLIHGCGFDIAAVARGIREEAAPTVTIISC